MTVKRCALLSARRNCRGAGVLVTTLLLLTTSLGLADPAAAEPRDDGGSTTTSRTPDIYPSASVPGRSNARICIGGIGGDCDEWYTNLYGHRVLVTDELNDYVKDKHGISKGMIRWVMRTAPGATSPSGPPLGRAASQWSGGSTVTRAATTPESR